MSKVLIVLCLVSSATAYANCANDLLFSNGFDGGSDEAARICHQYSSTQIACGKGLNQADNFSSSLPVAIEDCAKYTPSQIACAEKYSSTSRPVEANLDLCSHSAAQIQCAVQLGSLPRFGDTLDVALAKCVSTPPERMSCAMKLLQNDQFSGQIDDAISFCAQYTPAQIDCAVKKSANGFDYIQLTILPCSGAMAPSPVIDLSRARCGDSL